MGEYDLVGIGGNLEPATLITAYQGGMFPMPLPEELAEADLPPGHARLGWWSPEPRGILPVDGLRITRSLARSRRRFEVRVDSAFDAVITACAAPGRQGAWISDEIRAAYTELHRLGVTHSVEAWDADGNLAGGLYGVAIGGFFAGESMFHIQRDASKVALAGLVDLIAADGHPDRLLDVQWVTDHLASLGAVEVPRDRYLQLLERALPVELPAAFAGRPAS